MQLDLRMSIRPEQQFDLAKESEILYDNPQGLQGSFLGCEAGRQSSGLVSPFTTLPNLSRSEHAFVRVPRPLAKFSLRTATLDQIDTYADDHLIFELRSVLRVRPISAATADLLGEKMTCRDTVILRALLKTVSERCHEPP